MPKSWERLPHDTWSTENLLLEPAPVKEQLEASWRELRGTESDDVGRLSEEVLRKFVLDVCDGSVFLSTQLKCPERELGMVFLPVALGCFADWPKAKLLQIGVLYARMSEALPRSINGNPIFGEVRVLHKDDWARASGAISRELARRVNLEL